MRPPSSALARRGLVACFLLGASLDAQARPTAREPAEAALVVLADSLCARAQAAERAGGIAQVAFGGVLREELTEQASARCRAMTEPIVLRPGVHASTWRLVDFQLETPTRVRVAFEWEGGVPNAPGMSWFTNAFGVDIVQDTMTGAWSFASRPSLYRVSDGALRIERERAPPRRMWWSRWLRRLRDR